MGYLSIKRKKTLSSSLMAYDERGAYGGEPIKSEPRDKTPPHQSSPRTVYSPTYEQEHVPDNTYQQWQMPVNMPGPSHMAYSPDMQWGQNYAALPQTLPNMPAAAPSLPGMSANLQPLTNYLQPIQSISPNLQAMSPNMQAVSPNMQAMSPNMQAMSPNMQAMSPNMQAMSPNMHAQMSPMTHGGMSPNMGQVSPMGHVSPNMMQQQMAQDLMETGAASDTPSLTGLLMERGEGVQFNSGELSGLSSLLDAARGPDLSDSLRGLSTSDLLH